jgi:hypothetical protein
MFTGGHCTEINILKSDGYYDYLYKLRPHVTWRIPKGATSAVRGWTLPQLHDLPFRQSAILRLGLATAMAVTSRGGLANLIPKLQQLPTQCPLRSKTGLPHSACHRTPPKDGGGAKGTRWASPARASSSPDGPWPQVIHKNPNLKLTQSMHH